LPRYAATLATSAASKAQYDYEPSEIRRRAERRFRGYWQHTDKTHNEREDVGYRVGNGASI
jgi:hypothetical protein